MSEKGKAYAESMGKKDCSFSSKEILAKTASVTREAVPDFLDYSKKYRAEKVSDKTGWKVRPENRLVTSGSLAPADPSNLLIPCGFDQPSKGRK